MGVPPSNALEQEFLNRFATYGALGRLGNIRKGEIVDDARKAEDLAMTHVVISRLEVDSIPRMWTHMSALGHSPCYGLAQTDGTFEGIVQFPIARVACMRLEALRSSEQGCGRDDDLQDLLKWEQTEK